MAATKKTHTGDGATVLYPVNFTNGFISRDDVYVYLDGDVYTNQIAYTWVNDTQIQITVPVADTQVFYIQRIVQRDDAVNDYTDGAILKEKNLDDSYNQALMIIEEMDDGFVLEANSNILDTIAASAGASIVQEALPVGTFVSGERWYKPSIATTFVYFIDADSSQWVEENPSVNDAPDRIRPFTTVALMQASTSLMVGDTLTIKERANSTWEVISSTINNGTDILDGTNSNVSVKLVTEYDFIQVAALGGVLDNSTDNTAIVQAALDLLGTDPDRGGIAKVPRYMSFNLKNLVFPKRSGLDYVIGDDASNKETPTANLNTNERVVFNANANNAGIVNEIRQEAAFHPGFVCDVRKDVLGHTAFLGGGQTQANPARASYNIMDEQVDIWRTVWQNYNTASDFHGLTMHHWVQRITITGITTASFSTNPVKGDIITGTTSGAKGRLFTIDGSNMLLTWVTGEFLVGETVSDSDETTTDTVASQSRTALVSPSIGWNCQEGQVMLSLPTNMTNGGEALNVGGKVLVQKTRAGGQIVPQALTSCGFVWVDDLDLASPTGLEVLMDTTVPASRERLELHKINVTNSIGHVGAVRAYTGFSNSAISATTDYNISSIVRNSLGDYTITFVEPFNRADYTVALSSNNIADFTRIYVKGTTTLRVRNYDNTWALADLAGAVDVVCTGGDF